MEYRYDAFISYRHSELDMDVAKKIHKGLETFKVPKSVAKKSGKKSIKRVFRDQEELPIGSDLGDNITTALESSEFLIVICSPRLPLSEWCQKEIETFIKLRGREHILAVLIEGEPDESFPELILKDENGNPVEPLAADVRGATKKDVDKKLKTEIMRLAAPLLHCSYDDLRQRHRERRMKKIMAISVSAASIVAVLGLSFGIYNARQNAIISNQSEEILENESKIMSDTAISLLEDEGDRETAMLIAREALPSEDNDRPYVAEAEYALSQTLYTYDTGNTLEADRTFSTLNNVTDMAYSLDGTYLTAVDAGNEVYVWEVETGKEIVTVSPVLGPYDSYETVRSANVYGDNLIICTAYGLYKYDLEGNLVWKVDTNATYSKIDLNSGAVVISYLNELDFYSLEDGSLINSTIKEDDIYYGQIEVNTTGYVAAAVDPETEGESAVVEIYEIKSGSLMYTLSVEKTTIYKMFLDDNLNLAVLSYEGDISTTDVKEYIIEYFEGEERIFIDSEERTFADTYNNTCLKIRSYGEGDDETRQVLFANSTSIFIWNSAGEFVREVQVSNTIEDILCSTTNALVVVGQSDGSLDFINTETGSVLSDYSIDTGKSIRQLLGKNGYYLVRGLNSNSIVSYSFHTGKGMEELGTLDDYVYAAQVSPEGTRYMVETTGYDNTYKYTFFDASTNEEISSFDFDTSILGTRLDFEFLDENRYLVVSAAGACLYYIDDGSSTDNLVDLTDYTYWTGDKPADQAILLEDKTAVLIVVSNEAVLRLDLETFEVTEVADLDSSNYISAITTNADGSVIYICSKLSNYEADGSDTYNLYRVNADGSLETMAEGTYRLPVLAEEEAMRLSPDGSLLAIICYDSKLRVVDTATFEVKYVIDFPTSSSIFLAFSSDGSTIYTQGNDYYFKAYDAATGELVYYNADQWYPIEGIEEYTEDNIIVVNTEVGMYMLDATTKAPIAYANGGCAYIKSTETILTAHSNQLYSFPKFSLEELLEESEEQFPGAELSEEQMIRYRITR